MNLIQTLACCSLLFSLSACVSSTKQVDSLKNSQLNIPTTTEVVGVPFIEQDVGHCGPATLAMALEWAGKADKLAEVTEQVYTPGSQGSFQMDMVTSARRQGMMAMPIVGLRSLLTEVQAGHPVIVFENLALSWFPQWHYAIVFGYDLNKQEVLMHSGPEAFKRWDMKKFERSWKLGEYWGLVVLPPGDLSATLPEYSHSQAAAALEQLGHVDEADLAYASILTKWPHSLAALIGRGNVAYTKSQLAKSEHFLRLAVKYHPESAEAWNNLSVVQGRLGKKQLAQLSKTKAENLQNEQKSL